ncbi:hypothetical protein Tco_0040870 [Tanacetum coccineum]
MEEINNFQQEPDEILFCTWERFKELLMKCPQHYLTNMQEVILFYNGLDVPTRQILDSNGAIPSKTAADAKIAIQEMAEYSQKWHNGTSSRTRSTKTYDGLAAFQAQLKNEGLHENVREFTSEYYIPFALHPVVPAASASIADFPEGKVGCYTEKLDALRRWREMFFWVDDALVPWDFAFYTQGSLPRDERPPPGSYSMEDAELINENRIPINAYSEAFLCHMGISRNYFRSPEEVPTFIGDDGQEMDLFSVVHLSKPKLVTEGVRPLRDGEEPLLESTAGRTMELVLEQPEVESTDVLAPIPLRSVPGATVEPPRPDATSVGSSEDADVAGAESEAGEVDSGLKRKRATSDDGAGTSKRVRYVSLGGSTSTEEETPDAPPMLAAKEVTETPPLNVEATSDSSAPVTHAGQSPPQTSPLTADDISRRDRETGPKAFKEPTNRFNYNL